MTSARHPADRRGRLPARAEVVVVGGGAIGASVAFHLAEDDVDVLLLEADELASGSSGKPIGGVPEPDGLLLGIADPTTPIAFERTYDPSWLPLLRGALGICVPDLVDVPVARGWAGLYEMTPDHNALIGEATGVPGRVLYAAGFSGHGFLQAPAVGEVVRDLYAGRTPPIDVSGFSADRFAGPAAEKTSTSPSTTSPGRRGPEANII